MLSTPAPGGPHSISISDGQTLTLDNVLCGEVWLCGGQSNMEMPVGGSWGKVLGWEQELADAPRYDNIRLLKVKNTISSRPVREAEIEHGGWTVCDAQTLDNFSATAWFYGKNLSEELGVPVGLIESCWGGTIIEAWTSGKTLGTIPRFQPLMGMLERCMRTGAPEHIEWENASGRAIHAKATTLKDESGAILGTVCLMRDVSE